MPPPPPILPLFLHPVTREQVPNIDEEIKFYTQGLGMKVVRQREVNGARNVFVAYGEESLRARDGGG